ncbi:MAG: hypothetical protein MSJ26_00315 [Oscillospiraceae bacterium]|nr:hypothetical protein [Oscillospiraceae bacterium]
MMNKRLAALCFGAVMLTACGTGKVSPESAETEKITVSETEISSESISETTAETSAVTETEAITEAEAPDTSADYKTLYKEKLSEITGYEEYEPSISTFDIYDIDNDGTPELFSAFGNYHSAMVTIYSVRDGEVIKLCNPLYGDEYSGFGSWGMAQAADGGYIASLYFGMGSGYADYFRFENGELTHLVSSEHHMYLPDESEEEGDTYVIDGNEVSEEEYIEAVGKYEAMNWTDVGQGYRFFDMDEAEKVIDNYGK